MITRMTLAPGNFATSRKQPTRLKRHIQLHNCTCASNSAYKTILAFLLIALTTGCSTYSGTQSTAEMEFCWERGMNFSWIEEFDAGCVDPTANAKPMRIAKIKWLEANMGTLAGKASLGSTRNI